MKFRNIVGYCRTLSQKETCRRIRAARRAVKTTTKYEHECKKAEQRAQKRIGRRNDAMVRRV